MTKLRISLSTWIILTLLFGNAVSEKMEFIPFFEQYLMPIAAQSTSKYFSADELRIILEYTEDYGIELPEESREVLDQKLFFDAEYSKTGMLWTIVAAQYGKTNILWPVSVQKWYDDLIAELGLAEHTNLAIPQGDEIAQETAITIAKEYIVQEYEETYNLDDASFYQRGQTYSINQSQGGAAEKCWTIFYFPQVLEAGAYEISLDSAGNILQSRYREGFGNGSSFMEMYNMIMDVYGIRMEQWPQKAYQELKKAAAFASASGASHSKLVDILNETEYPEIRDEAITQEEAYRIAANQLKVSSYSPMGAVYIQATPNPVWKVNIDDFFYFEIDSVTGEIKEFYERSGNYQDWESRITLKAIKDKLDEKWKDSEKAFG